MRAAIVIPWRNTSFAREVAFQRVRNQAFDVGRDLNIPVMIHDSGDEPFSIARTWNNLSKAADETLGAPWERLVKWGADFVLENPVEQIQAALDRPEDIVYASNTSTRQTRREYENGIVEFRNGHHAGGPNVTSRARWDALGGFDERFVGYGAEDYATQHGSNVLGFTRARLEGRQAILWHFVGKREKLRPEDAYMERREPNLKLFYEQIKPIKTAEEWNHYLEHRYDEGRDNPFHPMDDDERRKWW